MKYYVYYDGYGNARKAISEEQLATGYRNSPDAFLKERLGSRAGERDLGGKGYVAAVHFDTEQERDDYLESLGEQISSYGGCRSQCQ